ncbi:unnamed protein product [Aphis gossypii]|uniref:Uncharacterized protein n=1 Tax=Aphis gossypii TaxID=80765 RepID=A0A9P0J6M9_APHGO|nr:unnamed protein product [Aphis gossypii]
MNALTIAVAVLSTAVTLSIAEATPNSYVSYKNPSACRSAEPLGATLDRSDSDGEGCTCSGSWQPQCCCPRPRPYGLPLCRQTCTCRQPSCSGPPATEPASYQTVPYSPWPTASTSCPDLPSSALSPDPCPCPAAAPVPVPEQCTCSPSSGGGQQLCPYCVRMQLQSCPCGGQPSSSVSGLSDFAKFASPPTACIAPPTVCISPPKRPVLPKLIPIVLKPLSFNIHRPQVPCRPGLGYGGSSQSLLTPYGCGSAPSPYEFYKK